MARPKRLWIAVHMHRHGISVYSVRSDREPSVEEAVSALDIDYEPVRGESISVMPLDLRCARVIR